MGSFMLLVRVWILNREACSQECSGAGSISGARAILHELVACSAASVAARFRRAPVLPEIRGDWLSRPAEATNRAEHEGKRMLQVAAILMVLMGLLHSQPSMAFGAEGHAFSGAVADRLLNPRAAKQVRRLLGMRLVEASTWADCVKDVAPGPDGFRHVPDARFHHSCQAFETRAGIARMIDYASRNWSTCGDEARATACHKAYHFADVAIQHDRYDRAFIGTTDHDIVSALNAAISVLRGRAPAHPFSIRDKKEALLLLAHLVGDLHQPLHVGAVYFDVNDHPVDPDHPGRRFDQYSATRGGNSISDGSTNLHAEWDAVPVALRPDRIDRSMLDTAKAVAAPRTDIEAWPAAWASETVRSSHTAFDGMTFRRASAKPGQWEVRFTDRAAYMKLKDDFQKQQLIRAGARLAQVLNALWPVP
jgi:hypothetical protein